MSIDSGAFHLVDRVLSDGPIPVEVHGIHGEGGFRGVGQNVRVSEEHGETPTNDMAGKNCIDSRKVLSRGFI